MAISVIESVFLLKGSVSYKDQYFHYFFVCDHVSSFRGVEIVKFYMIRMSLSNENFTCRKE